MRTFGELVEYLLSVKHGAGDKKVRVFFDDGNVRGLTIAELTYKTLCLSTGLNGELVSVPSGLAKNIKEEVYLVVIPYWPNRFHSRNTNSVVEKSLGISGIDSTVDSWLEFLGNLPQEDLSKPVLLYRLDNNSISNLSTCAIGRNTREIAQDPRNKNDIRSTSAGINTFTKDGRGGIVYKEGEVVMFSNYNHITNSCDGEFFKNTQVLKKQQPQGYMAGFDFGNINYYTVVDNFGTGTNPT